MPGATKTVKLRKSPLLYHHDAGVRGGELGPVGHYLPPDGHPALPTPNNPRMAAEATCLAYQPLGSVWERYPPYSAHVRLTRVDDASVAGDLWTTEGVLYEYKDGSEEKPLIMRAGQCGRLCRIMR